MVIRLILSLLFVVLLGCGGVSVTYIEAYQDGNSLVVSFSISTTEDSYVYVYLKDPSTGYTAEILRTSCNGYCVEATSCNIYGYDIYCAGVNVFKIEKEGTYKVLVEVCEKDFLFCSIEHETEVYLKPYEPPIL